MVIKMLKRIYRYITIRLVTEPTDKVKQIMVGEFLLQANADGKLDQYLSSFPNYSRNFSRLTASILKDNLSAIIIDIGANIGDTVALIRSEGVKNRIICIEGNELYLDFLKTNTKQFDQIDIVETFLSSGEDEIKGTVLTEMGTAKIVISNDGGSIPSQTLDAIVSKNQLKNIKILKVDTDGFDVLILQGATKVITKEQPVIFFEYDNHLNVSETSCFSFLISLRKYNYNKVLFYDNYGNFLMCLSLSQENEIAQLDNYIKKGCGAFPYFDVAVFHTNDDQIAEFIASQLVN